MGFSLKPYTTELSSHHNFIFFQLEPIKMDLRKATSFATVIHQTKFDLFAVVENLTLK